MIETGTRTRILALCAADSPPMGWLQSVSESAEITHVQSTEQAVEALKSQRFDLILTDRAESLAAEKTGATASAAIVLETLGQGVCIVDAAGQMAWANPRMRSFPFELSDQVREQCRRLLAEGGEALRPERPRHFTISTTGDQYFDVTATPILDGQQRAVQIAAVAWDTTHSRRLQRKLDAIDQAGRDIVEVDKEHIGTLNIEERLQLLEQKILRYMHDLLHFDNFAVLLLDKKTNRLEVVLQHGMTEEVHRLDIVASPNGNGISGYVAATGRSYICPDTTKDPRYLTGLAQARSSLTVPLHFHDQVIGVFDIESEQPAAFNEDDRQYAEILGRYVAMALNMLDLLVTERFTANTRLAEDVAAEIAGPLNDILASAATLMEEYIGHDDLRKRLSHICDQVTTIRGTVRAVCQPTGGLLGRAKTDAPADPLLSGKRVLVADDEEIIRDTISGVLSNFGCTVETAKDGAEAVAMLDGRSYDLVLADIKMPHKNGYEVFAASRDRDASRPVILITGFGYDPNHSIVRARREGLAAVLFKPFKVDQLLDEVRRAFSPKCA